MVQKIKIYVPEVKHRTRTNKRVFRSMVTGNFYRTKAIAFGADRAHIRNMQKTGEEREEMLKRLETANALSKLPWNKAYFIRSRMKNLKENPESRAIYRKNALKVWENPFFRAVIAEMNGKRSEDDVKHNGIRIMKKVLAERVPVNSENSVETGVVHI